MSIKIKQGFILREIGPLHMAVPFGELTADVGGMVALSETGWFLWQKIESGIDTEPGLVKALLEEYAVDEETAKTDVASFIEGLRKQRVLEDSEDSKRECVVFRNE